MRVTYFEALTALAFLWFADKPVGLGVFEVGMGGSWDATNLVMGDVAVITPDRDGPRRRARAPRSPTSRRRRPASSRTARSAVVRAQDAEALAVLARRAREVGADAPARVRDWEVEEPLLAVGGQSFTLRAPRATYEDLFLPLFGDHAARNAAAPAWSRSRPSPRRRSTTTRSARGSAAVRWPGRLEVVGASPLIVLDGAHNPAGAGPRRGAARVLHVGPAPSRDRRQREQGRRGLVAALAPLADDVYATRNESERSGEADPVAQAFAAHGVPRTSHPSVAEAIDAARAAAAPEDLIS